MIISVIYLLAGLATVLMVVALVVKDYFRAIVSAVTSAVLWLGLSIGSATIGIPYAFENSADNSVTTGIYHVQGPESALAWIFMLLGVVMVVYLFVIVTEEIYKRHAAKKLGLGRTGH